MPISKKKINDALEDWDAANLLHLLVRNEEMAGCFSDVRKADRLAAYRCSKYYRVMVAANEILDGHGVEYYNGFYYVNMGDTYIQTFMYNENKHKYEVGDLGYIENQPKTW